MSLWILVLFFDLRSQTLFLFTTHTLEAGHTFGSTVPRTSRSFWQRKSCMAPTPLPLRPAAHLHSEHQHHRLLEQQHRYSAAVEVVLVLRRRLRLAF
jgi:hypothetical protein